MESIQAIDRNLLLFVNGHHSPAMDQVMWWASATWTWLPLYGLLVFAVARKLGRESIPFLLCTVLLIVVGDQLASGVIKNLTQRARPSHDPLVQDLLHYVNGYRGGRYGFVSSHSMNAFALSFYFLFAVGKRIAWMPVLLFPWAVLLAYSRVYLGVHYPSDVVVPVFLSCPIAYLVFVLSRWIAKKYFTPTS